jgi:hypothetical protein
LNRVLRETLAITFWTFWSSAGIAVLGTLLLKWPLTPTYMLSVLTLGPTLAILRGRDRAKDPLEPGERAGAEILSLLLLLGIGWLAARIIG